MPSWNIHTAHVERLLATESLADLGLASANAFLFGNLAPDVYVGYMVPDASRKIAYKDTHFADPSFIPAPNASKFYELYAHDAHVSDLTIGAWTHLLCDHYYNLRTIEFIARVGVEPGEQTRIRKQADFDSFGRTLSISRVPEVTDELLGQAAAFPQYAIDEADVRAAVRASQAIVEKNRAEHIAGTPDYRLLTKEFFAQTFAEVDAVLREGLHQRAAGGCPLHLGRP